MSLSTVKTYFDKFSLNDRIIEFDTSCATVELAAKAIGCEPYHIAKSMAFFVEDQPIIVVTSGDMKINNSKFKKEFQVKAKMIAYDQTEEYIGHAAGGVCPFVVKEGVNVYLDESLKRFHTLYPAGGSPHSVIRLSLPELEEHSNFVKWVDVSKEI